MAETKVTYLIGAGASANALPVVNGMKERMRIFYYYLCNRNEKIREMGSNFQEHEIIEKLLIEIEKSYTIDTYAKMNYIKDEYYGQLKEFTAAYLLFEQSEKDNILLKESIGRFLNKKNNIEKTEDRKKQHDNLFESINTKYDYRYDSFFASLLQNNSGYPYLSKNINIVSWNYDNQLEISYSNFIKVRSNKGLSLSQSLLNIYPSIDSNIDLEKSILIKINGSADYDSNIGERFHDPINDKFDENAVSKFRELNNNSTVKRTNIRFSWENDEKVKQARNYAQKIIAESDIIVVIGYSFPTFNREVDRFIFSDFDKRKDSKLKYLSLNSDDTKMKTIGNKRRFKKIYIQDTKENAPKIKERLKAIGNNLFDVAEIYDDVDQFLIPYEL